MITLLAQGVFAMRKLRGAVCTCLVLIVLAPMHSCLSFARAETVPCAAPSDVPLDFLSGWCANAQKFGAGDAYAFLGLDLRIRGRACDALVVLERGASLKSGSAYLEIGHIKVRAECGKRDVPAAIAAFEAALKLRESRAGRQLRQIYEGLLGREFRDPERAIMWAYADYLIHAQPDDESERNFGRRLGLSEAQIDEGRERLRRWLLENNVRLRQRW